MLLHLQTTAEWTLLQLCEVGSCGCTVGGGAGGVIRCVTYVPFILIPSKASGLIKLPSDAILSLLMNGCANHTKMH